MAIINLASIINPHNHHHQANRHHQPTHQNPKTTNQNHENPLIKTIKQRKKIVAISTPLPAAISMSSSEINPSTRNKGREIKQREASWRLARDQWRFNGDDLLVWWFDQAIGKRSGWWQLATMVSDVWSSDDLIGFYGLMIWSNEKKREWGESESNQRQGERENITKILNANAIVTTVLKTGPDRPVRPVQTGTGS